MNIKHDLSTAYHHQSVGTDKRNHREFNRYIRKFLEQNLGDWENYIEYFTFCYNIEKHGSNNYNYSPYELVFSRNVNLPSNITSRNIQPLYNADNHIKEAKFRLQNAHQAARVFIDKFKQTNKNYYDKTANPIRVNVGDTVYVRKEPYDKLSTLNGKYVVKSITHPNITLSDGNSQILVIHKNRIVK